VGTANKDNEPKLQSIQNDGQNKTTEWPDGSSGAFYQKILLKEKEKGTEHGGKR
jgi:hypothetical protein